MLVSENLTHLLIIVLKAFLDNKTITSIDEKWVDSWVILSYLAD
jgi:hypothetical protein